VILFFFLTTDFDENRKWERLILLRNKSTCNVINKKRERGGERERERREERERERERENKNQTSFCNSFFH
jgi:hypothetical protein